MAPRPRRHCANLHVDVIKCSLQQVLPSGLEICSILMSKGYQILSLDSGHHKLSIHWDTKQVSVLLLYSTVYESFINIS
jgi:hypothetical protein